MASKQVTMDADTAAKMDTNGDGHISAEEAAMDLEFKRKRLEDADAMRDAQRNAKKLGLHSYQANSSATAFYQAAGFVQVSLSDGADNDAGLPAFRFEWTKETE